MIHLVPLYALTVLLLLTRTVVKGGRCLVDGEDEDLSDVDMGWTGCSPNNFFRNVLRDHWLTIMKG